MNYGLKRSQAVRIIQDCPQPVPSGLKSSRELLTLLFSHFPRLKLTDIVASCLMMSQDVSSCLILSLIVYIRLHLAEKSSSHVVSYCMKSCIFVLKNWLRTKTKWAEADSKTREHKKSHFISPFNHVGNAHGSFFVMSTIRVSCLTYILSCNICHRSCQEPCRICPESFSRLYNRARKKNTFLVLTSLKRGCAPSASRTLWDHSLRKHKMRVETRRRNSYFIPA